VLENFGASEAKKFRYVGSPSARLSGLPVSRPAIEKEYKHLFLQEIAFIKVLCAGRVCVIIFILFLVCVRGEGRVQPLERSEKIAI